MFRAWPVAAKITGVAVIALLLLTAYLAYLLLDLGISSSYLSESYARTSRQMQGLENFITNRDYQASDLENFRALGLMNDQQYNGKYLPWLNTKLGLVRFNDDGFLVAICQTPAFLADMGDCPDTL